MPSVLQKDDTKSQPAAKKQKIEDAGNNDNDDHDNNKDNTTTTQPTNPMEENDQGKQFLDISNKKRLTVRTFKGRVLIDIREVRSRLARAVCCLPSAMYRAVRPANPLLPYVSHSVSFSLSPLYIFHTYTIVI